MKEIPGVFHNDPEIPKEEQFKIEIIEERDSKTLWTQYISGINSHFMLLDDNEWPASIVSEKKFLYRWVEDWNQDNFDNFKEILSKLNVALESVVYVFWMKEVCIKTNWQTFCNNWANFLYEDEGCILVLPEVKKALVLSNGNSWVGSMGNVKT